MPKPSSVLSADNTFILDGVTVPAIRSQVEAALDAWYRAHPHDTPTLYVSGAMNTNAAWCVRHVCKSLGTPVKVYVEQRDKYTGRLA
jgi:hypothetical protein